MSLLQSMEFKVGAMVLAVAGLIAFMSMKVSDNPALFSRTQAAWFLMPDAAGLVKNSAIKSAGISVGTIKDIRLQDGQARIDIEVIRDLPLTTTAAVQIKSNGILGDKYVEIYPGSPTDPPLGDDGQILTVTSKGSLDNVMAQVSDVMGSLKTVADSLKEAVSEDGTRKHVLGRILKNLETFTDDVPQMTTQNKGKVNEIIDQVRDITGTLDDLINDESDAGFKKTWTQTMERVERITRNLDETVAKVNRGEGTIGKLIHDDTTVEELNTTIESVNTLLGTANRIQLGFDFHADHMSEINATKSYIGVKIQPGLDRFYEIGIIDDPMGVVEKEKVETTSGGATNEFETTKTYFSKTKFTVLFAKNFWDWTIKGGLIESSGGVGVDYHLLPNRLKLSAEAFDFANTNLRATARLDLVYGLYLQGGINDALDKNDSRSGYFGAGLFLTNDDLALLMTGSRF